MSHFILVVDGFAFLGPQGPRVLPLADPRHLLNVCIIYTNTIAMGDGSRKKVDLSILEDQNDFWGYVQQIEGE